MNIGERADARDEMAIGLYWIRGPMWCEAMARPRSCATASAMEGVVAGLQDHQVIARETLSWNLALDARFHDCVR